MKKTFLLLCTLLSVQSLLAQPTTSSNKPQTAAFDCYFAYNSSVWPKDSIAKFENWLKPYLSKTGITLELTAYTDTIGSTARNQKLAERRLVSVSKLMDQRGFSVSKSVAVGESYSQSAYTSDKLYRKVEVKLEFEENPVAIENAASESTQQLLQERMEAFSTATAPIVLNIQFVGGQDVYIGDSYLEVVALLQYLKENPKKKAFIRGHVCCFNDMELSIRRAYAVYNDLVLEGISPARISYKGFGNTMPAVLPEIDEVSRQQNRRVDVVFSE